MKPQPTDFELTQIWVQKYNSDHSVWKNLNVFHPLLMTLEVFNFAFEFIVCQCHQQFLMSV